MLHKKISIGVAASTLALFFLTDFDNDGIKTIYELKYRTNPIVRDVNAKLWRHKNKKWPFDGKRLVSAANPSKYITPDDPIVRWYAKRTKLKPSTGEHHIHFHSSIGKDGQEFVLTFSNSSLHSKFVKDMEQFGEYEYWANPGYYLTHGRKGDCEDWSIAAASILEAKGNKSVCVYCNKIGSKRRIGKYRIGYMIVETVIGDKVYAGLFDEFMPRDRFYDSHQLKAFLMFGKDFDFIPYNKDWFSLL